jgi:hypothetical protein
MDLVAQEFTNNFQKPKFELDFYDFHRKADDAFRIEFYRLIDELGLTIQEALESKRIMFVQYKDKLDRGIWLDNKEHILMEFTINEKEISWKIEKRNFIASR